jgi:hypothetical protein
MFHIPEEVFIHQILLFLKLDETLALLSSSNSLFEELRYRCWKFKVTLHDFTNPKFTKLLQKINPDEQLVVNCTSSYCGFIQADLSKVHKLSLYHHELTDVNCLSHLLRLSLSYCRGIYDVRSLGNIPELIIKHCRGICDISALQNNRKLSIHRCKNISISTVNFVNILHLSTDLPLTYAATTTLKNALSLELVYFRNCAVFLSSTVISVEIRNETNCSLPLLIDLSNFSQLLKSVLLTNISSSVDLTPLGIVEKIQLENCCSLVNVNGLGRNNKIVIVTCCHKITDLSALKTVPRVIINYCESFVNCEDLNQVHYLTIKRIYFKLDFSGLKREKGCRVHRLELLDCVKLVSFKGLDEIPFLKITSTGLLSLEGLGVKENKIIILEAKYEQSMDQFIPKECYSKSFHEDINSRINCLILQLMRK